MCLYVEVWRALVELAWEKKLPAIREAHERRAARDGRLTVWLGGPGKANPEMYEVRLSLQRLLTEFNCDVKLSEDLTDSRWDRLEDITARELAEIETFELVVLIAASVGSCAEAIEFAWSNHIAKKLWVYFPVEHQEGYVFRSLSGHHGLLTEASMFELSQPTNPALAMRIIDRALAVQAERGRIRDRAGN
jgi:hypothetical protein